MPWKFPPYKMVDGDVMHIEDVSEDLEKIIEEAAAQLNEHNFSASVVTKTIVEDSIAYRVHQTTVTDTASVGYGVTTANTFEVPELDIWIQVLSLSLTTDDSFLWISAPFQRTGQVDCHMYAIRVDGVLIGESILGTGEFNNETIQVIYYAGGSGAQAPGLRRISEPLMCEAMIEVGSGEHQIELCAYAAHGTFSTRGYVHNRQIFVIEIIK